MSIMGSECSEAIASATCGVCVEDVDDRHARPAFPTALAVLTAQLPPAPGELADAPNPLTRHMQ
jgi:hypothetical protein